MKKCTYCGKEYPDDATACAIDLQDLVRITPQRSGASTTAAPMDEAAARRYALKQKAAANGNAARAKGSSFGEIEIELQRQGLDEQLIKESMMEVEGRTPDATAEKNDLEMRHGAYWLVGGIVLTVITFSLAGLVEGGGVYIIAWGQSWLVEFGSCERC